MNVKRRRQTLAFVGGILASVGILAYLIVGHAAKLAQVADTIDWHFAGLALVCSGLSYVMMGLSLWEILRLVGFSRSFPEVLGITFVSSTANYLVSSAGVSGFALKAHLLRKRDVPYGATVTASVLSTALMYIVLAVLIAQGVVYLLLHLEGTRIIMLEGVFGLLVLAATSVPLLLFFFHREFRGRIARWSFHWLNRAAFAFSKREIPKEDFVEFESQLNDGLTLVRENTTRLTRSIVYICLDWTFAMMVLYCGLRAVGFSLHAGELSTGFAVGQAATLIPFLPGGLGAVEGAMTATLQGLGVDWASALMAVLLYRVAYYVIPGICSIFLYWGLRVSEPKLISASVHELPREGRPRRTHDSHV